MPDLSNVGASGAVVVVVIIFLKFIREENLKRDKRDGLLVNAINNIGKESKLTRAVAKSADEYLRERNGRDAKSHKELMVAVKAIPKTMQQIADAQKLAIIEAVKVNKLDAKDAHVTNMTVDHQEMKK